MLSWNMNSRKYFWPNPEHCSENNLKRSSRKACLLITIFAIHSPFPPPSFWKEEKNNQSSGQKSCLSARSFKKRSASCFLRITLIVIEDDFFHFLFVKEYFLGIILPDTFICNLFLCDFFQPIRVLPLTSYWLVVSSGVLMNWAGCRVLDQLLFSK